MTSAPLSAQLPGSALGFGPSTSSLALPAGASAADVLAWLNQTQGAVRYSSQQTLRWPYYSYVNYPAAGAVQNGFFTQNQSQAGIQFTNIENAGAFGNYSFLITGIALDIQLYIPTVASNGPWSYTTDALAPYADFVHGLTQGGVFEFRIAQTLWTQMPLPFLTMPPADGRPNVVAAQGGFSWTQAGMSPFAVTGAQASLCYADLERRASRRYNLFNPIFVAPQQSFVAQLNYPSGAIPVASTSVINNTTAFLRIGCIFDGWKFTPVS